MGKAATKARIESELEAMLALQLRGAKIEFERRVKVIPGRKFEFDFAVMNRYWLIECDGGTWGKGGHSTHAGIHRDMVKHNLAQLIGYSTLRFDREMIEDGTALSMIEEGIGRFTGGPHWRGLKDSKIKPAELESGGPRRETQRR